MSSKIPFSEFTIANFKQFLDNIIFPIDLHTFEEQSAFFFNPSNRCWDWKMYKNSRGYGEYKHQRINRCSYFFFHYVDAKELLVCHSCDNPECCNPKHLWLGNNQDNSSDMVKKNRSMVYDHNNDNTIKLNNNTLEIMFQKILDGEIQNQKQAAEFLNVSVSTVSRLFSRKLRRDLISDYDLSMVSKKLLGFKILY